MSSESDNFLEELLGNEPLSSPASSTYQDAPSPSQPFNNHPDIPDDRDNIVSDDPDALMTDDEDVGINGHSNGVNGANGYRRVGDRRRRMDNDEDVEDEEGEDLFGDDMMRDYEPIPEMDVYSPEGLDDNSASELSITARIAAEAEMRMRDREEGRKGQLRKGLEAFDASSESDIYRIKDIKRKRLKTSKAFSKRGLDLEVDEEQEQMDVVEHLENTRGLPIREFVSQKSIQLEIHHRFKAILRTYTDEKGKLTFREKIRKMSEDNRESFEVSYKILAQEERELAWLLIEAPFEVLEIFNKAAKEVVLSTYPAYERIVKEIFIRITDLPFSEEIRGLRQYLLNQLIRTFGVVTSCTSVLPQLRVVKYDCNKCGYVLGPFIQNQDHELKPGSCPECQSLGPFTVNMQETAYQNYQRITVQEPPGKISAGRIPRSEDVILLGDLCDTCKPGDEIDITGIFTHSYDGSLNIANGFPVFATVIMANNVVKQDDWSFSSQLSDEDQREILKLSRDIRLRDRIIASIAPSIYGHTDIKRALALALFGGESKNPGQKHRVRGDLNILMCGDPGTAKSQFLKFLTKIAPRCVFTTGQGASAVGLTAFVHKSPVTREWSLEAGALVLADKGVCLIDEFDKMSEKDRTSIHEAMEQQSISISKAGIVASLQARCAVIAAANPIGGRYDNSATFSQNVDLTEPIISRFDILCVVRDIPEPIADERLAKFVVRSHMKHHPWADSNEQTRHNETLQEVAEDPQALPINQELLKKYIMFARERIHPKLHHIDRDKISKLYGDLRRESLATGSIPITVRHIESIIRCAEAHAKMHLRDIVTNADVDMAIRVVLESFIQTQKFSVMKQMRTKFFRHLRALMTPSEMLLQVMNRLFHDKQLEAMSTGERIEEYIVEEREFIAGAKKLKIHEVKQFYDTVLFQKSGTTFDPERKVLIRRA